MTAWRLAGLLVLLSPLWTPAALLAVRGVPARVRALGAAGAVTWAAGASGIAVARPAALGPLAALVLAGWAWRIWRARPAAGRRRGLPPGSLGFRSSIRALADYGFYHGEAARWGPIFKTSQYERPVLCVVGLERCQRLLREHRERLASAPLPIDPYVAGGLLRYMEPAKHGVYRRRLQACMRPRVLSTCELAVARTAARELAAAAANGGVQLGPVIDRFVFAALTRVFFGIPDGDPAVAELRRLYGIVDHRRLWRRGRRIRAAMAGISATVLDRRGRGERSADGIPASFLEQAVRDDPDAVADPVFVENLAYFLHIARCDLAGLCAWLLRMLADHPEQARRIAAERAGRSGPAGAAERFVDETLRLRQSEYLYRSVARPLRFEGYSIPAGWLVRLCVRESHTSDASFPRPHAFDPNRFLGAAPPLDRYQPFGIYEHACLGVAVTKTIGRVFVGQLASGFELTVTRDGPMELGLHHHAHWRPSRRLEVRLVPRRA